LSIDPVILEAAHATAEAQQGFASLAEHGDIIAVATGGELRWGLAVSPGPGAELAGAWAPS
jgi:hypothetical protein